MFLESVIAGSWRRSWQAAAVAMEEMAKARVETLGKGESLALTTQEAFVGKVMSLL